MMQAYSDPRRASDPEARYVGSRYPIDDCPRCSEDQGDTAEACHAVHVSEHVGWYWETDGGEPMGPFATADEARESCGAMDDDRGESEAE
jgi:hypothetical protein